jgi:hypothetical protein
MLYDVGPEVGARVVMMSSGIKEGLIAEIGM